MFVDRVDTSYLQENSINVKVHESSTSEPNECSTGDNEQGKVVAFLEAQRMIYLSNSLNPCLTNGRVGIMRVPSHCQK